MTYFWNYQKSCKTACAKINLPIDNKPAKIHKTSVSKYILRQITERDKDKTKVQIEI